MKISVITPSFNQGKFIERTIRSVVSQDYSNLEYIVMDGGSTDQTVEIINKYAQNISHWISEKDEGQTFAVNRGFRASTGKILGWLNSDDIYYPGTLQKVADYFAIHPGCNVIYGLADYIDEEDRHIRDYPTLKWNYKKLKNRCYICQPSVFFRRSVFERYGPLDESLDFCMDYDYWLRCGATQSFSYMQEKLAASRLYAENKTLSSRPAILTETIDLLFRKFGNVPRRWIGEYSLEIAGMEKGYEPVGAERLGWTAYAIRKYHMTSLKYNQQRLPLFPLQFLWGLPLTPKGRIKSFFRFR